MTGNMKRMNVLQFICPSGFYGAEMWVLALTSHLDRKEVNCSLAVTVESGQQNLELFNRFERLGLKAYQIPMAGRFDLRAVSRLVAIIKEKRIDILHTHGYKSDIIGILAARLSSIKIVCTPHGFENAKDFKLQMFIKMGCFALRFADRVAPLSPDLMNDCRRLKIKRENIKLIINGVDLTEVEAERESESRSEYTDGEDKVIGYVGQLAFRKNIDALLSAFDLLYHEHKNIRLVLVGDGPQRKNLEQRASTLVSAGNILFLGFRNDRLRIVKGMDVFCMTSSLEGIPRCVMEAMAIGTPVTAFNIPGIDQLIIHGKTGLLADFNNVEDLKENLKRLLFDKSFSDELIINGRNHILSNYSAVRMADEYTDLFRVMVR